MKPEDEIFLSAYLDGELNADERSCVESAMLSDPALIERLRHLATVNDLLSSLPRPALRQDVASSVVRRIDARRSATWATRLASVPRSRIGLAAAALVVLSVTAGLHLGVGARPLHHPAIARVTFVDRAARPAGVGARTDPAPVGPAAVASRSDAARTPGTGRAAGNAGRSDRVDAAELRAQRDQDRVRGLLDNPNLTRVLIVVDEIGGTARDRVETLVRQAPRIDADFGRISIAQGITIDPRYPGEATVFAVAMSDDELRRFKGELNQKFPGAVEDVAAEPAVVTQLSGIGQVAVLSGTPAVDLHAPPASASAPLTAMRTGPRPKTEAVQPDPEEFPGMAVVVRTGPVLSPVGNGADPATEPGREPRRPARDSRGLASAPPTDTVARPVSPGGAATADPAGGQAAPGTRPDDRSIVLVWVTTRERRPGDGPAVSGPPAS